MGRGRPWTQEELEYLENNWGSCSNATLAKRLGRSLSAIHCRAFKMGLGNMVLSMDGISINQLSKAIGLDYKVVVGWISKYNFPAKKRLTSRVRKILIVKYDDFWKWAKEHQGLLDFRKFEENSIGPEPPWAKEARRIALQDLAKKRETPWTKEDETKLLKMVNAHKYTYTDIAKALQRTENAIKKRLDILGVKARPVRQDTHIKWTPVQEKMLIDLYDKGYELSVIGKQVGKSEHAVRGKLERMGYRSGTSGRLSPCEQIGQKKL